MSVRKLLKDKSGLLNIFYTAGYPNLNDTVTIAQALDKAGVRLVEIGMPYSDPLADGTTIQHSSEVALRNGMNLDILFKQAAEISETTNLTLILMGYLNQLLIVGVREFLNKCKSVGVSGLIIPDLPIEIYEKDYKQIFQQAGIEISFLITPRTSDHRIKLADKQSTGFIYMVADNSITGSDSGRFSNEQLAYFKRIKDMNLSTPLFIGFGIKTKEQFLQTKQYAHGAIIGSEFIRRLSGESDVKTSTPQFIKGILK